MPLPSHSFTTNQWSGGTTTELFIYPEASSYQERNFLFRLSTANVEVQNSTFTSLPGVSRKLMILDGKIMIHHDNRYSKNLNVFDTDEFEGDWNTTSVGKCRDFNLMLRENTQGDLTHIHIQSNHIISQQLNNFQLVFVYIINGSVEIKNSLESISVNVGDLLIVEDLDSGNLIFSSEMECDLVLVKINLQDY